MSFTRTALQYIICTRVYTSVSTPLTMQSVPVQSLHQGDTTKTRMQAYVALFHFANLSRLNTPRTIISEEGIPTLWKGVRAIAMFAGPAYALFFALYEAIHKTFPPTKGSDGDDHPGTTAIPVICSTIMGDGIMTRRCRGATHAALCMINLFLCLEKYITGVAATWHSCIS